MNKPSRKQVSEEPSRQRRTGGRSARVTEAVLASALEEISQSGGLTEFNVGSVAKRAKVHETTIYRRWPKKEDLIADACMQFADANLQIPDTGSLREDLRLAMGQVHSLLNTPLGQSFVALCVASRNQPEFRTMASKFWRSRMVIGQQVFRNAISRGEWPEKYSLEKVFGELFGPVMVRVFLLQEELTEAMWLERVESVLSRAAFFKA